MRVTLPPDRDVEVRPGTPAAELARHAGVADLWCGTARLDPDHPAGHPPLVHAARLTAAPWHPSSTPDGPHLEVVRGPDAGGMVPLGTAPVLVGRGRDADLVIDDPAVSARHAHVMAGARPRVRDLGSANGVHGAIGGAIHLRDPITLGRSQIALRGIHDRASAATHGTATPRWTGAIGSVVAALMLAIATGQWYLAVVGLIYPATTAVRAWRERAVPETHGTDEVWPDGPVAVVGDERWVRGYVRALVIARGRRPAGDQWSEPWQRWLADPEPGDEVLHIDHPSRAPSWCASVVEVSADAVVTTSRGERHVSLPMHLTADHADAAARRRAAGSPALLPPRLHWADLPGGDPPISSQPGRHPVARIGAGATGPVELDLDREGPHILVAGTTGSGKSVLLETLVGSLAHAWSPADLAVALIDFKGGAGLRSCMDLPHVAGVLTDLDGAQSRRALAAIAQELTDRKAQLAHAGHSDLASWERAGDAPPRLLVVIDEYQEIAAQHAEFVPELARLAAQGRSLGLHLVLATQRPAGAVTPEVRANVGTTIALRVASVSESRDVIGVPDAALLDRACPGRAIIATGEVRREFQVAAPRADPTADVQSVDQPVPPGTPLAREASARHGSDLRPAPLWAPPLPTAWTGRVSADAPNAVRLALADDLRHRRHRVLTWDPRHGVVVVAGPPRSGRTSTVESIARQAAATGMTPVRLPTDAREAARVLALAEQRDDWLLLIDDADRALSMLDDTDEGHAADALMARLKRGAPTVVTCSVSGPARIAAAAEVRVVLSGAEASAAAQWGVPRELAGTDPAPGRAVVWCDGRWWTAQVTGDATVTLPAPVASLPRHVSRAAVDGAWGVGGDDATPMPPPTGRLAVVGPDGPARDAVVASVASASPDTAVSVHEVVALAPAGVAGVVLVDPRPRDVRQVARADWRGMVDPVPVPLRIVLVQQGRAMCVQLASP